MSEARVSSLNFSPLKPKQGTWAHRNLHLFPRTLVAIECLVGRKERMWHTTSTGKLLSLSIEAMFCSPSKSFRRFPLDLSPPWSSRETRCLFHLHETSHLVMYLETSQPGRIYLHHVRALPSHTLDGKKSPCVEREFSKHGPRGQVEELHTPNGLQTVERQVLERRTPDKQAR
ncbi:enolase [Striga asiatica]|uniref:Enolase n=1 Tax=Striga asiatica TaxID=4170 RepID=A0A5A7QDS9_STRAF|nr:enolase [Striga asiatica]